MSHIKIIKTKQDHIDALTRISDLMDKELVAGSVEADELEVLALLAEMYEKEYYPMDDQV